MKREKTSAIFQKKGGGKNGTNFFFEQHKKIQ